jgi:hypothetical protein
MHRTSVLAAALVAALFAAACGAQQSAGQGAGGSSAKAGGPRIELAGTTPSPCPQGRCHVAVTVTDVQGQAVENADVRYEARHTGMNHGTVSGAAESRGGGRYEGALTFSMAGDWSVGVQVRLPGNNTVHSETLRLGVR